MSFSFPLAANKHPTDVCDFRSLVFLGNPPSSHSLLIHAGLECFSMPSCLVVETMIWEV